MILKYACVAMLLGVAGPTVALAQTNTSGSESGQQFLQQVSTDSMNEIQEALLAEQKAENPCVKAFARLIVDDHTMLESELGAVAHSASFNMANNNDEAKTTPPGNLQSLTGAQFDRAYIDHEVKQHEQDMPRWQQEANGNSVINSFAKIAWPVQREHLELAQAIQAQLQNGKGHNG